MGHLAIVMPSTINDINGSHPFVSYRGTLQTKIYKTISDLFADALAVRAGDYIFTWCVNENGRNGIGFDRYYIASGDVYFAPNEDYPIKVGVTEEFKFANSVSEESALDIFRRHLLWNAIGKKSLGRGRSLSHQTTDEDNLLLSLLHEANNSSTPQHTIFTPNIPISYLPITISNFSSSGRNPATIGTQYTSNGKTYTRLSSVPIGNIIWNKGNEFICEKTLEAYLCQNIDNPNINFCTLIGHPGYHVNWAGNYLPYGVAGDNIDMVVEICNDNDEKIVVVIELKVVTQSYSQYKYIVNNQLSPYVTFIKKAFESYRDVNVNVEYLVLSRHSTRRLRPSETIYKNAKWIVYSIDYAARSVNFSRLL